MYDTESKSIHFCSLHKHKNDNFIPKNKINPIVEEKGATKNDSNANIEMSEESLNASGLFLKNLEQDTNLTSANMLNAVKFP